MRVLDLPVGAIVRRLRDQRGFTLVEVMVAAVVVALGLFGLMANIDRSRQFVTFSERKEAAAHIGEQALEEALATSWASLGLSSMPGTSADAADPRFYVRSGGASYQWDPDDAANEEPMILAGILPPGPEIWNDGRLSGQVFRFVTWYDDASTPATTQDLRRVTVAVTVDGAKAAERPTVVSSLSAP